MGTTEFNGAFDARAASSRTHVPESRTGGTPVRELDYGYDALNRLVSEEVRVPEPGPEPVEGEPGGAWRLEGRDQYTYDDVGNRLAKDVCTGDPLVCETTTYAYNANNQVVESRRSLGGGGPDEVTAYFYNSNGSLIEKAAGAVVTTYAYDAKNRMVGWEVRVPEEPGGAWRLEGRGQFAYDVDGIRVAKTVNGSVTNFLVDKVQPYAQVVEERDGSGVLVASYTYGNDLVSQSRGTSTAYYAYDGLGSTRALTDASGAVTDSYTYDAFGETVSETGSTENAYRFTGEQFEAGLQLYYLRARYYDPAVGRFGVMDKWGGDLRSPLTLNEYLYANGNPAFFVDPTGNWSITECMMVVSIRATLAVTAHPYIAGTIGLVINALIPEEVHNSILGMPGFSAIGELGKGEARVVQLLKNPRVFNWIKSIDPKAAGGFTSKLGTTFEEFVERMLGGGGRILRKDFVTVGKNRADFELADMVIEVKSGSWSSDLKKQLAATAAYADEMGKEFCYIFLNKPTPAAEKAISNAGGTVVYLWE